ncbi:glycine--tRNA ligase [Candidatus Woesearchaeota archaeon]|nr:glycine--tRNA ligase [Candidatus Woesearchaeota archaeon]
MTHTHQTSITTEQLAIFCKQKGFVFQSSELYGGLSGIFDYGPLGVNFKNNIKQQWWNTFVNNRPDIVGIDGAIVSHAKIWKASGHVDNFEDILLECKKCKQRFRGDHLVEDVLKITADGLKKDAINKLVQENSIKCPNCKGELADAKQFNLMFATNVGPVEGNTAYLRPETAQLIFTNFKLVVETARLKLPFGIAQQGKAFRNEISPRDFIFRCREFEQMEMEYFIHPLKANDCSFIADVMDYSLKVYSEEMQHKKNKEKEMTIKDTLKQNIIKTQWHGYWLAQFHQWFVGLGVNPEHLRIRQHVKDEKSHYALDTWDLEYHFPMGWKELQGFANRTDFDLHQHMKHSGKDLSIFDEETKQKVIPHVVAEPALGVERAMLVFLFDAYHDDKKRGNILLKLHPKLAPIKVGVFPLVNKLEEQTKEVYQLLKDDFVCQYDRSGSVGRRYARADEIGIPYCITFDFDSLEDKSVTVRDRDTTSQIRVKIDELYSILSRLVSCKVTFKELEKHYKKVVVKVNEK